MVQNITIRNGIHLLFKLLVVDKDQPKQLVKIEDIDLDLGILHVYMSVELLDGGRNSAKIPPKSDPCFH